MLLHPVSAVSSSLITRNTTHIYPITAAGCKIFPNVPHAPPGPVVLNLTYPISNPNHKPKSIRKLFTFKCW